MISFDAVDFSERRSEEVTSFFWRSVYIYTTMSILPGMILYKVCDNSNKLNNRILQSARVEYIMVCAALTWYLLIPTGTKSRIQFIIMKIFMKIVKICPKSSRFVVILFVIVNCHI